MKVEMLLSVELSKSEKVQPLKLTQSIKVKSRPLKNISTRCANSTEPHLFTAAEKVLNMSEQSIHSSSTCGL